MVLSTKLNTQKSVHVTYQIMMCPTLALHTVIKNDNLNFLAGPKLEAFFYTSPLFCIRRPIKNNTPFEREKVDLLKYVLILSVWFLFIFMFVWKILPEIYPWYSKYPQCNLHWYSSHSCVKYVLLNRSCIQQTFNDHDFNTQIRSKGVRDIKKVIKYVNDYILREILNILISFFRQSQRPPGN